MRNFTNFSRNARRRYFIYVFVVILLIPGFIYVNLNENYSDSAIGFSFNWAGTFRENVKNLCAFSGKLEDIIPDLPIGKARHDNKRILRIYDFHYTGNGWESLVDQYDICFATQTSIERIYWLPYVLEKWTGPLSLAVHLTSEEEWLILNLYTCYLSKCHGGFQNQVSLHLAVPSDIPTLKVENNMLSQWNITNLEQVRIMGEACPEAKGYLNYLLGSFPTLDKEKLRYKEVYPQNHMRNIARKGCGTDWTYSADIDIIPRSGMADMLQEFYDDRKRKGVKCERCAFVIPTFEMNETYAFPISKMSVSELFRSGAARQFHGRYYSPAHNATDYQRWTTTNMEEGPVLISHEILSNQMAVYEPFYVSPDDIPPYDERFLGYGFTRNSQFKAAYYAGWKFYVLSPVFSIHWGLQSDKTVLSPKKGGVGKDVRREQTRSNYKIYKKILAELELKRKLENF